MSLISSLPFCVEEFESLDEVYDEILVPWFNLSGPDRTGFKGTLFPLALTKEQVHALYWKVKSIELDYEVTDDVTTGGYTASPESAAEVPEEFLGSDIKTAILKRVCGGLEYLTYEVKYYTPPPSDTTSYDTNFLGLFDYGGAFGWPRCLKVENTYYPLFRWREVAYGGDVTTYGVESISYSGTATSVVTYLAGPTVTLNFPDSSTATFETWRSQRVNTSPSDPTTSATAIMTTSGNWAVSLW
jgi:hypothetical protein